MSPEEQNKAIAAYLGWTEFEIYEDNAGPPIHCAYSPPTIGFSKSGDWEYLKPKDKKAFPNYTRDLNAMHEAEKVLLEAQWSEYRDELRTVVLGSVRMVSQWTKADLHATAAQRCEAFLRVLNLWKES